MKTKSFKDISWQVTEDEYREDSAYSYSTLATFVREGFGGLKSLFDKKETKSLTFGSAVDAIITGGEDEFRNKFLVGNFPEVPDSVLKILKVIYEAFGVEYSNLKDVPYGAILRIADEMGYQKNWKPETRVKVIIEKGEDYYKLLSLAEGKTVINEETYTKVLDTVDSLRSSEQTRWYFSENLLEDNEETLYQLKFRQELSDGLTYRCMADVIKVDHLNKEVWPIDLKTSSHDEWDFYKSFVEWNYQIQARLYYRVIRKTMDKDPVFRDYKLHDYRFVVVNKDSLVPLAWEFPFTKSWGDLTFGKNGDIVFRDPENIGYELDMYIKEERDVPFGIDKDTPNDLIYWINKML